MSDKKVRKADGKEEEDSESFSADSNTDTSEYAWIPWYCSLKGNELFCEVVESFAQDPFNLTGLSSQVPYYEDALDMILDIEASEVLADDQQELVENDAENLFGLIHARYILTNRGLHAMYEKYKQGSFGKCPRVQCREQNVLPVGMTDITNKESVKLYCPCCEEVYHSYSSRHLHIDGAYFGTTFPHLFFLTFPELKVPKAGDSYIPRVFGYKINKNAYTKSLAAKKQQQQTQQLIRQ